MVRGLFDKWKQLIYYDFDKSMSADTLLTVINSLYEINYIVVAVTCDMGPTNIKVWNELDVKINISTYSGKRNVKHDIEKLNSITHPTDVFKNIFLCRCSSLVEIGQKQLIRPWF